MNIRRATVEDVDRLAQLNRDVQQLHAEALPHLFKPPDDLALLAADFRSRILVDPDGHTLIVEEQGEAVGYVYAHSFRRPETAYTYAYQWLHIDQLSVKPACRGKGYGRALIEAVFDLARGQGIERVTLDTWEFNQQAQAFFARMGFKNFIYRMDVSLTQAEDEQAV